MNKKGLWALLAGGAALTVAGVVALAKKNKVVDLDEDCEYEVEENDYEAEESED